MLVIVNKAEFYATVDLSADDLKELLAEWQHYYNWERPHSAHNGKTPMEHYFELAEKTPYSDAVHAQTISPMKSIYRNRITSLNLN